MQNVHRSIPRENYNQKFENINIQCAFRQPLRTNPVEFAIANSERERAVEDNEMGKMLCQLVKQQSAPTVDIEEFDGNPLQYTYSRSMFQEIVEKKIPDPQKRLKQLVKLATEVRELFKPFVHDNLKYDYKNAISYWRDSMGTHSSCRHVAETK